MVRLSLILCTLFICSSCLDFVVSGSYNYAEEYGFDISQDDLKALITDFKEENGYVVPFTDSTFKERYGYMDYYAMYIYSPIDSTCFNVLVFRRPKGEYRSYMYLISISSLEEYHETADTRSINYTVINRKPENEEEFKLRKTIIKRFEDEVLSKLGIPYKALGNGMGI